MTNYYGNPKNARLLVIGHDPRLQQSDTSAEFAFFADYYFRPDIHTADARAKYGLAKSVYDCVLFLTAGSVSPSEVLVTNLCNDSLPPPPKGKTVLIREDVARRGIVKIELLLQHSPICVILAMSQQVNYWLQLLGFCQPSQEFCDASEPREEGLNNDPPFYAPQRSNIFKDICGHAFETRTGRLLIPILHAKHWPLKGRTAAYQANYDEARLLVTKLVKSR